MEQQTIPQWLDAAVKAAGITTAYNDEDWDRFTEVATVASREFDAAANDPSAAPH
jgi:hypothetical protein